MRSTASFFVALITALMVLTANRAPAIADAGQSVDAVADMRRINHDVPTGDPATNEAAPSEVAPSAEPSEAPTMTSTLLATIVETIPPTATPFPTGTSSPTETIFVPDPTVDSTTAPPVSPTGTDTETPTLLPHGIVVTDILSIPTSESRVFPALPTATPFPTLVLPTAVPTTPVVMASALPALATFDAGAPDWLASLGWSLQPDKNGIAWVTTSTSTETLYWQAPILLSGAAPVTLSFQSWLLGGVAIAQVSTDGYSWQPVSLVPPSDTWATVSIDLSSYIGNIIYISFWWQGASTGTPSQWAIDTVLVAEGAPTLLPTVTMPSQTDGKNIATTTPIATLQPIVTPPDVALTPATTLAPYPIEILTAVYTITSTAIIEIGSPEITDAFEPAVTATPNFDTILLPTESDSGSLSTPTAEYAETQPGSWTEEATELVPSATSTENTPVAATAEPTSTVSLACLLDIDADRTVTDSDLSEIGREVLTVNASKASVYDLDGNYEIDIGDLQMMASHLFETCSE